MTDNEDEDGQLVVHTVAYGEIVMYMVTATFDTLMEFLRLET